MAGRPQGVAPGRTVSGLTFSQRELRDLLIAWLALGLAFTFFLEREFRRIVFLQFGGLSTAEIASTFAVSLLTVGVGFLFAAPGAVVHRGRLTARQHGLIAVAGPVTNIGLAVVFLVPFVGALATNTSGFLWEVARMGLQINLLLAGFNMLPFGPLDGRTVKQWSTAVFLAVAVPSILLAVGALFLL